jgi:hypothetical protein
MIFGSRVIGDTTHPWTWETRVKLYDANDYLADTLWIEPRSSDLFTSFFSHYLFIELIWGNANTTRRSR